MKMNFKSRGRHETEQPANPERKARNLEDLGIRDSVLEDIALKILYLQGPFSILDLSDQARISYDAAEQLFIRLRAKLLCEVTGMTGTIQEIAISSQGRTRALELLTLNQYSGAMPVSLANYVSQVQKQKVRNVDVHPADVKRAFSHLVFDDEMLSDFGSALNSGNAVFLYGPPGVGKTAAAETLSRVFSEDKVWLPYAVEAGGQIITVYDPAIHGPDLEADSDDCDRRWARCKRPTVTVGGELTVEMLDLQYNPLTSYYDGPPQMKANNGVLIIDDFGRQRIPPEDLLNRWVVPLDRGIEFLTLVGGRKIEIPFEVMVVFASNMDPAKLLDPAFLRRIQTKIKIGAASEEHFRRIFHRVADDRGLQVDEEVLGELIHIIQDTLNQELRACFPRDLVNQVCWKARYEGREPRLDRAALMKAVKTYFVPPE
jgi:energy-coupling factor transporter ATP-binding protein EcfA2